MSEVLQRPIALIGNIQPTTRNMKLTFDKIDLSDATLIFKIQSKTKILNNLKSLTPKQIKEIETVAKTYYSARNELIIRLTKYVSQHGVTLKVVEQ
tara:strand:+ start:193 stop:480 length:288 start_codon:yes stop_codon:yes gene_type:complete